MIQINDNDSPIQAAEKIIHGTKPFKGSQIQKDIQKSMTKFITGIDVEGDPEVDMFDYDDIVEIRDYLNVWINSNINSD